MSGDAYFTAAEIERLTAETDPWLSCDDCFDLLDSIVENILASAAPLSAEFRVHLRGCAVCHEEAQSLMTLIADEHGLSPEQALERLEFSMNG